jgi:hypothetical protein
MAQNGTWSNSHVEHVHMLWTPVWLAIKMYINFIWNSGGRSGWCTVVKAVSLYHGLEACSIGQSCYAVLSCPLVSSQSLDLCGRISLKWHPMTKTEGKEGKGSWGWKRKHAAIWDKVVRWRNSNHTWSCLKLRFPVSVHIISTYRFFAVALTYVSTRFNV